MPKRLSLHLNEICQCLEEIKPEIDVSGSEEQRQLVSMMQQAVLQALSGTMREPGCNEQVAIWRHEAIRPVNLCINSAELLLTDDEQPLSPQLCVPVQRIYDTALKLNDIVHEIAEAYSAV